MHMWMLSNGPAQEMLPLPEAADSAAACVRGGRNGASLSNLSRRAHNSTKVNEMRRRCALPLLLSWLAIPAHADAPEGGRFYGMLRSRDLTPFGFLRLDMRPGHAMSIESRTFAFEAELGYQNTWALSENVEKYLKTLEPSGRRELDAQMIQAIQDLPGENYLLDVESATLDLAVHYKISSQWSVYAFASAVSYHGGFMDRASSNSTIRSASTPSAGSPSRAMAPTSCTT